MSTIPGVELVESQGQVVLRHHVTADRPPVDANALKALLEQGGYGAWFVDRTVLSSIVDRCNSEQGDFEANLAERRDAHMDIEIASDGMRAWGTVTPAYGGAPLSIDQIVQTLTGLGVVYGMDESNLMKICLESKAGQYEVATGLAAVDGDDGRFELLINLTRDRRPRVDENGLIDFRELGDIPVVDVGQPLMRRIPPTDGTAGRSILAKLLYPKRGRDEMFAAGLTGAAVSETDHNLLVATERGQPVQVGYNGVMVEKVIHFDGATMASGNISFDGTVHIDGDVLQGMKVLASGDVVVSGTVDGGIVEAGGSILVKGGVIAHATLKAGTEVSVRFVENSKIEAGVAIAIDDMALQSELRAANQIAVGIKAAKRGRLVGGSAQATMRIITPILGDAASSVTQVMVGLDPALEAELQAILSALEKQHQEADSLSKLVQHLSKQGDKAPMLERAQATLNQIHQAMGSLLVRKAEVEKKMALYAKAKVEVGVEVSGSVDLAFGHTKRALRRAYGSGSFSMEGGLVLFTPHEGDSSEV
ncbi:MAG: DUF342 domain-containing protein [Burkholderiales bacterium]|nr:DUF342 domain-containing protein [Burkholderiales bacterium]